MIFQLGVQPAKLSAFTRVNINKVPRQSGIYVIYEPAGPFYVGRSGSDIRRRLLAHLSGTGNRNVKIARKIIEVRDALTFTYALLPREKSTRS